MSVIVSHGSAHSVFSGGTDNGDTVLSGGKMSSRAGSPLQRAGTLHSSARSCGCCGMRRFLFGTAALILLASPAVCDDVRRPVYKAPLPALTAKPTACGAGPRNGSFARPAALSSANRSVNTRWKAGAAVRRPVATISLPAVL